MSERRWLVLMVVAVVLIGGVSGLLGTMVNPSTRTVTVEVPIAPESAPAAASRAPSTTVGGLVRKHVFEPERVVGGVLVCGWWRKCRSDE